MWPGGAPHDCLKILYANDAKLFVPVENIDVISRYGIEDDNIQLDTIGGLAWQAKKARVKQRIRDIAEKLIKIAAERHLKKAENFVPPQGMYDEFCAKFPYNETDDQMNAISDVLQDLNCGIPMDRLVCGRRGVRQDGSGFAGRFCGGGFRRAGGADCAHDVVGAPALLQLQKTDGRFSA